MIPQPGGGAILAAEDLVRVRVRVRVRVVSPHSMKPRKTLGE